MSRMNIPGFSAEASVYRTGRPYASGSFRHTAGLANSVQPALAIYVDGRYVCNGDVNSNGFINCYPPGGGGQLCRPSCSPCVRIPGEGRIKTCVRRNCDVDEVPC